MVIAAQLANGNREYGGLLDRVKEIKAVKQQASQAKQPQGQAGKLNYATLVKRDDLYRVYNSSDIDLIIDWDLPLLPQDIIKDVRQFLNAKYINLNIQSRIVPGAMPTAARRGSRKGLPHCF